MMIRPGIDTTIRVCSKALMVVLEQYDTDTDYYKSRWTSCRTARRFHRTITASGKR